MVRISDLPEEVRADILGFLPTRTAAHTSLLQRQWRKTFRTTPSLEFEFYDGDDEDRFVAFVDRVMELRGNFGLRRFSLGIYYHVGTDNIDRWINYALDHGVNHLELSMNELEDGPYVLPPRLFTDVDIVGLKLAEEIVLAAGVHVHLPSLKSLSVDNISLEDNSSDVFVNLIAGCTSIEELEMTDMHWQLWDECRVISQTLKSLKIKWDENRDLGEILRCPSSVSFYTPNLLYLEYTDHIVCQYPTVNFDSLIGATIRLQIFELEDPEDEEDNEEQEIVGNNATDLLTGINRVSTLHFSANTLELLGDICQPIPEFDQVSVLRIESSVDNGWESLPTLLRNCPNLDVLIFQGVFHNETGGCGDACRCGGKVVNQSCLSISPVSVLQVYEMGEVEQDKTRFFAQMKHFLDRMPNLERLTIYGATNEGVMTLHRMASRLRRTASPNCNIEILRAL